MSLVTDIVSRFKAQLASKVIKAVAGAVLAVGLARVLDPGGYGLLFLAFSVMSVFKLASIGIGRSAGTFIAEYKETDRAQVPYIVRSSLLVVVGVMLIAAIALISSYRVVADVLGEPDLAPFLLLGVLFVVFWMSITFLELVLQGFEAIRFVAGMGIFDRTSRVVFALGLAIAGFGAIGALWGYVISAVLTSILGFIYLLRRVRRYSTGTAEVEPGLRRRILAYAAPTTATNMSRFLDQRVDTLLVGYFLSPVSVSYYVIAGQMVNFIQTPLSALGFTLSPTFGAQKAAGNVERISRLYEEALLNGLLLYVPAGVGIALVADPAIPLVFGSDYAGAVPVLQVLGLYVILKAITKVSDNGLDFLGRARERAIAKGVTAALNVALNVVLIPTIGVVGAAIATLITQGLYTVANVYITAQEFDLRGRFLLKNAGTIAAITAVMSAVVYGLSGHISGWLTLGLVIVAGVLVWAVMSMATGLLRVREIVSVMT